MRDNEIAQSIFFDALQASLPENFISKACHLHDGVLTVQKDSYELNQFNHIYVFGSGKAAVTMAYEIEKILEDKITAGLVIDVKANRRLQYIEVLEGSHPLPSQKSIDATQKLVDRMSGCTKDDLFIYLLSGGSSALVELSIEPITLDEVQAATQLMLHSGMDIVEINSVRKHLSRIKGGGLSQLNSATGIVLVLSDIVTNDLGAIGSAPLFPDATTFAEAKSILQSKDIFKQMPQSIQEVLQKGEAGLIKETLKQQREGVKHYLLASNEQALKAAKQSANSHGLSTFVYDQPMSGNVVAMVETMCEVLKKSEADCLLFGGECTVEVAGNGQGGRNQHAVALMFEKMCQEGLNICFLSAGTDGIDGNSDAAGALVCLDDCHKVDLLRIKDHIRTFDTHNLFKDMDRLILTGATGTNVIDIAVIIKRR